MTKKPEFHELGISPESLNQIEDFIKSGNDRYSLDENAPDNAFNKAFEHFPLNTEPEIVAMKIALVDMTNSTNLGRILGNKNYVQRGRRIVREVFALSELVEKITKMADFDERVSRGDIKLVDELTQWSMGRGANLMSFFSKYCLYHNYCVYKRDDYSIYDSVVRDYLGEYLSIEEFQKLFPGRKLRKRQKVARAVAVEIDKMRKNCDYTAYWSLLDRILKLKNITEAEVPFRRRKLDHFVWYLNRSDDEVEA